MLISLYHRDKENVSTGFFWLLCSLVAFALLCYVHTFATLLYFAPILAKQPQPPPQYQPPKVQLLINLNFWFFEF